MTECLVDNIWPCNTQSHGHILSNESLGNAAVWISQLFHKPCVIYHQWLTETSPCSAFDGSCVSKYLQDRREGDINVWTAKVSSYHSLITSLSSMISGLREHKFTSIAVSWTSNLADIYSCLSNYYWWTKAFRDIGLQNPRGSSSKIWSTFCLICPWPGSHLFRS